MKWKPGRRGGVSALFGLGVLACAACCAAPLLVVLGVSVGASAAIAMWAERVAQLVLLAVIVGAAVWFAGRRLRPRPRESSGCVDTCAVDTSCGCAPATAGPATGCTLPRSDAPNRMQAFRELFAGGLRRTERTPGAVAFVFVDNELTAARVKALIEQERACCSFLTFEVNRDGRELRWTTHAEQIHGDILSTWAELPSLAESSNGVAIVTERLGLRERDVAA